MSKGKPGTYYEGGYRYLINGIPTRFPRELSPHALAVIRGESNTKKMRGLETTRYPQTVYSLPADGWCHLTGQTYGFVFEGRLSQQRFSSFQAAKAAYLTISQHHLQAVPSQRDDQ